MDLLCLRFNEVSDGRDDDDDRRKRFDVELQVFSILTQNHQLTPSQFRLEQELN